MVIVILSHEGIVLKGFGPFKDIGDMTPFLNAAKEHTSMYEKKFSWDWVPVQEPKLENI